MCEAPLLLLLRSLLFLTNPCNLKSRNSPAMVGIKLQEIPRIKIKRVWSYEIKGGKTQAKRLFSSVRYNFIGLKYFILLVFRPFVSEQTYICLVPRIWKAKNRCILVAARSCTRLHLFQRGQLGAAHRGEAVQHTQKLF